MKTTVFALREKKSGKLLSITVSSNEGADFCGDVEVSIDTYGSAVWEAKTAEQAEYVRNFPTPWYNAGMETPNHSFEAWELEVVKIERTEEISLIDVKIPTVTEWVEKKYRQTEPAHADYLLKNNISSYSWYDLKEVLK